MSEFEQRAIDVVRRSWADSVAESPAAARVGDVRAAARFADAARRGRSRSFALGLAGGLAVAAAVAVVLGRREAPPPAVVTVVAPPVSSSPSLSPALPSSVPAPPSSAETHRAPIIRSCNACKKKDDVIDVPSGSKLLLAFSLDASFAEPEKGVVVEGPAKAKTDEEGVLLLEGRARVNASKDARVRTATIATASDDARYTIEVDGEGSSVVVQSGHVKVTMSSGETRVLSAGERASTKGSPQTPSIVSAAPAPAPAPAPPPRVVESPKKSADERWTTAKSALESGDRSAAERELRALVADVDGAHPLYARASFRLAELELARGATLEARPRLQSLLSTNDAQLAEDAAVLYARSYPTPAERANAWATYLATNPASPRRERAMLERVRALAAAGRSTEARAATSELCATQATDACRTARDVVARLP